ncbi:SDR family NAD(P)-dependent oxidoreductase [Gluconacetobacter sp. Hr-1-5]|uniref:SDR family NAD(P)-dependent oxidoreductase n=1 Tax=Gluconacetobacter sp. Hr-1-5 TaxID=3395370 RepID=UPI003B52C795
MNPRHVMITGGSRGIGRAIARHFAHAGDRVTILGRDRATLDHVVEAGDASLAVVGNVTSEDSMQRALDAAVAQAGEVEVLVNNAGGSASAPFIQTTTDDFRNAFTLNTLSAVWLCHQVLPGMVGRGGGRIVNVASTAALKGYAYVAPYVVAKHALLGLTRALALEYARHGVTINAVCPGFTDSDLVADSIARVAGKTGRDPEAVRTDFARFNPRGHLNTVDEVAVAVAFLCGRDAGAINGIALPVAGGEVT